MTRRARALAWLRDRWNGQPGRHAYAYDASAADTRPIARMVRAWPSEAEWTRELQRRILTPRLYSEAEAYWRQRWIDFGVWLAWQTVERNQFRRECGLPELELPPPPSTPAPIVELVAA